MHRVQSLLIVESSFKFLAEGWRWIDSDTAALSRWRGGGGGRGRYRGVGGRGGDLGTAGDCLEQCAGHGLSAQGARGCSSFISGLAFGFRGWLAVQLDACVPWSGAPHCAVFFMRGLAGEKMSLVVNWLSGSHLSFEFF